MSVYENYSELEQERLQEIALIEAEKSFAEEEIVKQMNEAEKK